MSGMRLLAVIICWLAIIAVPAVDTPAPAGPPFVDGDVVAVIGDSITHDGRWHRYVADFYATRYPGRLVRFVNCGIAGDTAAGVLKRLDSDILPNHPTAAVVMLGMNDVGRGAYGTAAPAAAQTTEFREKFLTSYRANLTELVMRLRQAGIKRIVLVTPSPFDQTAKLASDPLTGVNDALGRCAQIAQEVAQQNGCGVVDFHAPMTALNLARQQQDPAFTLIGNDRVHPAAPGHLVMAWLFLQAQGVSPLVSRVVLDASTTAVAEQVNAQVGGMVWKDGVTFTLTQQALPLPLNPDTLPALQWVPLAATIDREELAISHLPAGTYQLSIDAAEVGRFAAAQFADGIDLACNPKTPQFRQAQGLLTVANDLRTAELPLRNVALVDEKWLPALGPVPAEPDQRLNAAVAKAAGSEAWKKKIADDYRATKPDMAAAHLRIDALVKRLYEAAQPKPHTYLVKRVAE